MKAVAGLPGDDAYGQLWQQWDGADAKVTGAAGRTGPEVVARAVRAAIEDPATPLRVPVGHDAEAVLDARARLTDAEFESAMRRTLGMTW